MRNSILIIVLVNFLSCNSIQQHDHNWPDLQVLTPAQDSIVDKYVKQGAWQNFLYSHQWQEELDKGLAIDSTIAYMWQQKAMPLYKQGKYELGKVYLDKAVMYNREEYQSYRAFMTCIFAKRYGEALADFEDCKERFGNGLVMDHSYSFYIALCHLMLNQFQEAEQVLSEDIREMTKSHGADFIHFVDHFYHGVALYELESYEEAILALDKAIEMYPEFSDALYYKAICQSNLGEEQLAKTTMDSAKMYGKQGHTITDDNVVYERYPYQVRW